MKTKHADPVIVRDKRWEIGENKLMKTDLKMDKPTEVTREDHEMYNSTLHDRLNIPTELQRENVKQENYSSVNSEIYIKTEPYDDDNELPDVASTSHDTCSNDDIKLELFEPMIQIEYTENDKMQSSLDVGNQIKDIDENEEYLSSKSKNSIKNKRKVLGSPDKKGPNSEKSVRRRNRKKPNESYTCDICYKIFPWQCYLNRHLQTHNEEKPFKCHICEKAYNRQFCLDTHMLSHSVEKPFACDECNKVFRFKSNLTAHKLTHSDIKLYSCSECNKAFKHKSDLVKHTLIHTGDKAYTCEFCSRSFTQKITLTLHRRLHTGEKPYSCDVCNKSFSRKSTLNIHEKVHKNN